MHIITRMDTGGSATNTRISVERLPAYGYATALLYGPTVDPNGDLRRALEAKNIPLYYVSSLVRNPSPWNDLYALLQIKRVLRAGAFDLVHTHTSKAGILGRLAAHFCNVPVIHTPHGHIFYGYFNRWITAFYVLLERWMAHYSDRIVSLTANETEEALARKIGQRAQYVVIPSGVPLRRFLKPDGDSRCSFREQCGLAADDFVFVSVGRLVPIKGYDILLAAFGEAARALTGKIALKLIILGDGPERPGLEKQAQQCAPAKSVIFMGEQRDVRPALWAADAFVLASRNEGMGRAFVEALAAGLPCIGTRVGGVSCVIREPKNGLLVLPEDPGQLSDAMRRLAADKELYHSMAAYATPSVFPDYDEDTMVQKLADLYGEVLAMHRLKKGKTDA